MTPHDFSAKLVALYTHAHTLTVHSQHISRGRARDIASEVEEWLAQYVIDNTPRQRLRIYIDYHARLEKRLPTDRHYCQPDLLIVDSERQVLVAMVEIKIDMGYMRKHKPSASADEGNALAAAPSTSFEAVTKLAQQRRQIQYQPTLHITRENVETTLALSPHFQAYLVLCTSANSGKKEQLQQLQAQCAEHRIPLHVLMHGAHPNAVHKTTHKADQCVQPDEAAMDAFIASLLEQPNP